MRAAVLEQFGRPLALRDIPDPVVGHDEVLVAVHAVGLCGTDLKINSGAFGEDTPLPMVTGHEIAGQLVNDYGDLPAGTDVACYFYTPCGACGSCARDESELCRSSRRLGFEQDGGLATYVAVRGENVLPFDASIGHAAAAVAMDAVTTPWHALKKRGAVASGERVLVVGAGGLGLNAVQIARHLGAEVAALDTRADRRLLACELGAQVALGPDEIYRLADWSDGGVDLVLDTSGTRAGFEAAVAAVRSGGRIVCCGYQPGVEYGLDSARLVLQEITVLGSRLGSREDA
ncbi:MAG: zinc-binding dehydrogenase, partial [Actinomycetota bacterium]